MHKRERMHYLDDMRRYFTEFPNKARREFEELLDNVLDCDTMDILLDLHSRIDPDTRDLPDKKE